MRFRLSAISQPENVGSGGGDVGNIPVIVHISSEDGVITALCLCTDKCQQVADELELWERK